MNNYQDFFLKDGEYVGKYEEMYQMCNDPWNQSWINEFSTVHAVLINNLQKLKTKKVLEVGCGLGYLTNKITKNGFDTLGIDVSETAIKRASKLFPECSYMTADILDFALYKTYKPDVIVLAEVVWYVLDKIDSFIEYIKSEMPETFLICMLNMYGEKQQYGREKFTNLRELLNYFGMNYIEYGEITRVDTDNAINVYFIGKYN